MRVHGSLLLLSLAACHAAPSMPSGGTTGGEVSTGSEPGQTSGFTTSVGGGASGDETGAPEAGLDWGACPAGFVDECAVLSVPLRWDDPSSDPIEVMVARKLAARGPARAQLWLLQGGPGHSADFFAVYGVVDELAAALPDVDIYTFEHRGVGHSSRLSCSQESDQFLASELDPCLQEVTDRIGLEGLAGFSTTSAAHDLHEAIAQTNTEQLDTYVYGFSYGSSVALRFLQLFPDALSGVVLDGVVAPGRQFFSDWDRQFDPVGQKIAELCAQDSTCSEKLGEAPWSTIAATVERLDTERCLQEAQLAQLDHSMFFAQLLADSETRDAFAPLVYRLGRCGEEDRAAFFNFIEYVNRYYLQQPAVQPVATLTWANIMVSELWPDHDVTDAELEQTCEDAVLCPRQWAHLVSWSNSWPRYEDPHAGKWPDIRVPMLAMNGELDPQTTLETAQDLETHIGAPNQAFVAVPYAPHSVLMRSPVLDPEQPTCGLQMMRQFVEDPNAPVDTGCLDALRPLDFVGTPERATALFGTSDLWENDPEAPPAERSRGRIAAWTSEDWDAFFVRWRRGVMRREG